MRSEKSCVQVDGDNTVQPVGESHFINEAIGESTYTLCEHVLVL